jgi:hypothetical protein
MFWSPNLTKYSYWRLPLEQHHNTDTYSNLLTNILIMIEMEGNWDLNLLALPLYGRLSIGVGFGDKLLTLNSLNKVVDKIILNLHLSLSLILPTHNKVLHKSNVSFRPQFGPHPPFFLKLSIRCIKVKISLQKEEWIPLSSHTNFYSNHTTIHLID